MRPAQEGHRSRNPQPWIRHKTRVANRQRRRKYGCASSARHRGQNCRQVELPRRPSLRTGSRNGFSGDDVNGVTESFRRERPVRAWSRRATSTGSRRSRDADHIPGLKPSTRANARVHPARQQLVVLRGDDGGPPVRDNVAVSLPDPDCQAWSVGYRHNRLSRSAEFRRCEIGL